MEEIPACRKRPESYLSQGNKATRIGGKYLSVVFLQFLDLLSPSASAETHPLTCFCFHEAWFQPRFWLGSSESVSRTKESVRGSAVVKVQVSAQCEDLLQPNALKSSRVTLDHKCG